jgi:hypothetical protein
MRLSRLQKFILEKCYEKKSRQALKTEFYEYYGKKKKEEKLKMQVAVHNSIENLVIKDLVIAFGRKTREKWFIEKVKLTAQGKRKAKELIKEKQRKLPIK